MKEKSPRSGNGFLSFPFPFWVLAASDLLAVLLAVALAYCLRLILPGSLPLENYLGLLPALLLFPPLFATLNLYPGNLIHASEELKLLSRATTIGFAIIAVSFFLFKNADVFSRAFFIGAWFFALLLVPLFRYLTRRRCHHFAWWKTPVILFGGKRDISELCRRIETVKSLGFTPVACIFSEPEHPASTSKAFPARHVPLTAAEEALLPACERHTLNLEDALATEALFQELSERHSGAVVTILLGSVPRHSQEALLNAAGDRFYRLILVPPMDWLYCMPDKAANLCGFFALTVRRNLCDSRRLRLKRIFDLLACGLFTLATLPLFLALVLLIRLDTPGPAIFRQTRVGRGGKLFQVFKFRTMQADAATTLKAYLAAHPEEAEEWAKDQKLRHDPRVTRVGRFLRRTSLDELPQLFNVLRGEMSFVGPRPIVEDEIKRYGDVFAMYAQVLPGITGLWQISGRNDVSYEERVALDRYYITNWSVWLDWYILARTVPVVLGMRGAY